MKKLLLFLLFLFFITGLSAQTDFFYSAKGEKENFKIRKDMVILKFEPETDLELLVEPSFFISAYTFGDILQTCRDLYETGWCEIAEPSFFRTIKPCNSNPLYTYQWGLKNTNQVNNNCECTYTEHGYFYDINVEPAWDITKGVPSVKVAVLDVGVQLDHPDLADNLILGYDATDGNYGGINGGYKEMDDHGTKCAGIIGALDNNIGTVGVAPNCKIVSVRIGYKPSTIKGVPPGNSLEEWITTDYWIEQNSIYTLSKNELEYLANYVETHTGRGVVFANNILCSLYGICKDDAERQKSNTLNPDFQKAPLVAEEIKFPFNKLKGWTAKPDGVVKNGEAGRGSLSENIKIHPNPTTGELTIDNGQLTITGVEIFDVLGKKQFSIVNSQLSIETIDISHLHSGIYFVKITTDAGIVVKKIIKQ